MVGDCQSDFCLWGEEDEVLGCDEDVERLFVGCWEGFGGEGEGFGGGWSGGEVEGEEGEFAELGGGGEPGFGGGGVVVEDGFGWREEGGWGVGLVVWEGGVVG